MILAGSDSRNEHLPISGSQTCPQNEIHMHTDIITCSTCLAKALHVLDSPRLDYLVQLLHDTTLNLLRSLKL